MEIQNEIVKTKERVNLLEHQNEKFKDLLEKAVSVTKKVSSKSTDFENEFLQESIEVIEEEKKRLKNDLSDLIIDAQCEDKYIEKINHLEKVCNDQQHEIEILKAEHAEIKFLLLHPESRKAAWLKNILELENDVSESTVHTNIVEERFRLQRKILNLEKKKAELLLAINDAAIPEQFSNFLKEDVGKLIAGKNNEEQLREYEELRFQMLNMEDERSRLLNDLQCVLDRSRKQISAEYDKLQAKIEDVEKQKANLKLIVKEHQNNKDQEFTGKELESIFNAFRNLPLKETDENARIERIKADVGSMFCPGINLPLYCNIL